MRHLAGVALLSLALLHAASAAPRDDLVGSWYTEGVEGGRHIQFLITDNPDGTFTKAIRDNTDCRDIQSWTETGTWTFRGGLYSEVTATIDGAQADTADPENNDAFDYQATDAGHMTLSDRETKIVWSMARVAPDYDLPSRACTV